MVTKDETLWVIVVTYPLKMYVLLIKCEIQVQ